MAEDDRGRGGVKPLDEMQIAVAQPGKGGAQQHLARAGLVDRNFFDCQRLVRRVQDGGFHRGSSLSLPRMLGGMGGLDHIHDFAQRLLYSSWWRSQYPGSLRPLGARSSHWYMPHKPSNPRA